MIDEKKLIKDIQNRINYWENKAAEYEIVGDTEGIDICVEKTIELGAVMRFIKDMPKVGEWIPVSERMPKEHEVSEPIFDSVTLAEIDVKHHTTSDLAQVTVKDEDGERFVYFDYTVDGKWFCYNEDLGFEVLAWQPLPEPAKEKKNEKRRFLVD